MPGGRRRTRQQRDHRRRKPRGGFASTASLLQPRALPPESVASSLRRLRHFQPRGAANRQALIGRNALDPTPDRYSEGLALLTAPKASFAMHKIHPETSHPDPAHGLAWPEGGGREVHLHPDPGAYIGPPLIPLAQRTGALRRDSDTCSRQRQRQRRARTH